MIIQYLVRDWNQNTENGVTIMPLTKWKRLLVFCGLVVVVFLAEVSWAQDQSKAVVVPAKKHVVAPSLSQIVPIPPQSWGLNSYANDDEAQRAHWPRATRPVEDPVLQRSFDVTALSALTSLSTTSGLNILGLGSGFPGFTVSTNVPDTNGAVGTNQFVQFVNDSFAVFNKSNGSRAYGPAQGNTLWQALGGGCAANPNSDEIAQYDKLANRWVMFMAQFTSPTYLCIAVSKTSDAVNGGWNLYAFQPPMNTTLCNCRMMTDYPKLAVWPDGYYLSYNQIWNGNYEGPAACVFDRNSMLNGAAATMQCFLKTNSSYGSFLPGDLDGTTPPPAGSPAYFLNFDGNDQSLDLWKFHVDWTTPANSTSTGPTNIPVAAFTEACSETVVEFNYTTGDCIPQAGTSVNLDSYGDRVMYRLAYRNLGNHQSLVANHTVTTGKTKGSQTGIRWYELRNTGSGFGLYQQGTYSPDSSYRWMGSIAMDKVGDIALGYSVSSASMSPSIRYTGRVPTDSLGQLESEIDVLSSASIAHGSRTNNFRWADYSSLAIDPTDDCTFWYTTQYMPTNGGNWSTRIASFGFPSCKQNSTLTVGEVGQGTVTSTDGTINCTNGSGTCGAVYANSTAVTTSATAASGWKFTGWSGACSGGNPCNLVMNRNLTVTANFTSWTIVHEASASGASLTIPTTGSGHLISAALMFNGTTSVTSVSDNVGNAYVSAGARAATGSDSVEIWYVQKSIAGATVITPHFAGSPTFVTITAWEVSGVLSAPLDAKNTASGSITLNNTPGPPVTTTKVGDFIVSVLFATNTNFTSISSGNEFTNDFTTYGNGWAHITSNSSSAGTHWASWYTSTPTGKYCASTVAFAP